MSGAKKKAPKFFYAVSVGNTIGIFDTWKDTNRSVTGFPKNNHQKFKTFENALKAMKAVGINEPDIYIAISDDVTIKKSYKDVCAPGICLSNVDIDSLLHLNTDNSSNAIASEESTDKSFNVEKKWESSVSLDLNFPALYSDHTAVKTVWSQNKFDADTLPFLKLTNSEPHQVDNDVYFQINANKNDLSFALQSEAEVIDKQHEEKTLRLVNNITDLQQDQERLEDTHIDKNNTNCCTCKNDFLEMKSILQEIQYEQRSASKKSDEQITLLQKENCELKEKISILSSQTKSLLQLQNNVIDEMHTERKKLHDANSTLIENIIDLRKKLENAQSSQGMIQPISPLKLLNDEMTAQNDQQNKVMEKTEGKIPSLCENKPSYCLEQNHSSPFKDDNVSESDRRLLLEKAQTPSQTLNPDASDTDSETNLKWHASAKDQSSHRLHHLSHEDETSKKNSLKLPSTCRNLLMGDSNMKNVEKRRLDRTGYTDIRTYKGATVKSLTDILNKCDSKYPDVRKVSICIGTNNCSRQFIDERKLLEDFDLLIDATKRVFCSATICLLAIPPQRDHRANKYIYAINKSLKIITSEKDVLYKPCNGLWGFHVSSEGVVDDGILYDSVHLSPFGLGILLQNVIHFFFGRPRLREVQREDDVHAYGFRSSTEQDDDWSRSSTVQGGKNERRYAAQPPERPPPPTLPRRVAASTSPNSANLNNSSSTTGSTQKDPVNSRSDVPDIVSKLKSTCLNLWKKYTNTH